MRIKDNSVGTEFHPMLTKFLFAVDQLYRTWDSELVITSGSEDETKHGVTSLHYAKPCCAADSRIWEIVTLDDVVINAGKQHLGLVQVRDEFCKREGIPANWFDVVFEGDHIHTEFQPKRPVTFAG